MGIQQTSLEAYNSIDITQKQAIYIFIIHLLYIYKNGLTDNEIYIYFTEKGKRMQPKTRRNELMKMGYIYTYEKRKCTITGKTALVWKLTTFPMEDNFLWKKIENVGVTAV